MHDRTLQPGQRRNNQTTEPGGERPEVTQETPDLEGITWTDAGLHLRRLDWMTDAQWDYVRTSMTSWWDGFWTGYKTGAGR